MKDYKDFTHFLTSVKSNELYDIKLELTSMIILLNGNCQKISEAITYAKTNSDFNFDTHIASQSSNLLISAEDKFLYQNGELSNNFSQERLNEVLRLYPLMCGEKGINKESKEKKSKDFKSNKKAIKIIIVGGVAVTAYLLYEIIK